MDINQFFKRLRHAAQYLRSGEDTIPMRSNLRLTMRERGKIVGRREGHNIFVDFGREYLAKLISYSSYTGVPAYTGVPEENSRIEFISLGIGGEKQTNTALADTITDYGPVGGIFQTDTSPVQLYMERHVRVSWLGAIPVAPNTGTSIDELWFGRVDPIVSHPSPTETMFVRVFSEVEINGPTAYYPLMPISEMGLHTAGVLSPGGVHRSSLVGASRNPYIAYDVFETITKTNAISIEINWTLKF
jgi:hypothetical protein